MRPIKTERANFTYLGDGEDVGDLPCERPEGDTGPVYAVYQPSADERAAIAGGAQLKLGVMTQPIPPVSLEVVAEPEASAA